MVYDYRQRKDSRKPFEFDPREEITDTPYDNLCLALESVDGIVVQYFFNNIAFVAANDPISIWFRASRVRPLNLIARCISRSYGGPLNAWKLTVEYTDLEEFPVIFNLKSTSVGAAAGKEAEQIMENIYHHLEHKNYTKMFGIKQRA